MKFKDVSVRTKVGLIFGVVLLFSFISIVLYLISTRQQYGVMIDVAGRNRMLSQRIAYYSHTVAAGTVEDIKMLSPAIRLHEESILFLKNGGKAPGMDSDSEIPGVYTAFKSDIDDIQKEWEGVSAQARNIAEQKDSVQMQVALEYIHSHINNQLIKNDKLVKDLVVAQKESQQKMNIVMILVFIITIISAVAGIIVINHYLVNPLKMVLPYFMDMSNGIVGHRVDIDQNDEMGLLAKAFNKVNENLSKIVGEIISGAENIVSGSGEISASSIQLSQGASQQAASSEEISASVEEMTANIQQNTQNSMEAKAISLKADDGMKKMISASKSNLDIISTITEKTKIINDISFQTNILALNAAVEAARAGEHGRGFAVVAAEVRKLAERSKIAANEISLLSKNSMDSTLQVKKIVEELTPEITKTVNLIQEIAASSSELETGANQINTGVSQMNNVIQQNAASAEELASSSEEFASQAESLKDTISFFHVEKAEMSGNRTKRKVLIEWGQRYMLGINSIDQQHKRLVDLINELHYNFGTKVNKTVMHKVITELVEYTQYHFGYEEQIFDKIGYSDSANHIDQHRKFVETVSDFYKKFETEKDVLSMEIVDFLKNWLVSHILGSDRKYVSKLKEKGIN